MKIAIDISQTVYDTGVSHYVKNLVTNLLKVDKDNTYLLFAGTLRQKPKIYEFTDSLSGNFTVKTFPIPPVATDFFWNGLHIGYIEKLIGGCDIVHTSDWAEPPSRVPKVTTVHDLAPILHPGLFPRDKVRDIVRVHAKRLSWVRKESSFIITPSEATKVDMEKLDFDSSKIRVVHEAVNVNFAKSKIEEIDEIKKKYKISGDYLLAVGTDPRKNAKNIIEAFKRVMPGRDLKLVFIGSDKYSQIVDERNIRFAGHVPTEDLPKFYSAASALVYPSFYEGFGLPILEAFACGCPVVTSNISSMAEVAGDAAAIVDPYSIDSIVSGIESVLRAPKSFIEKGHKRAKDFSWEDTAKKTLEVYNLALQKQK